MKPLSIFLLFSLSLSLFASCENKQLANQVVQIDTGKPPDGETKK